MALRSITALAPAVLLAQSFGTRPPHVTSRTEPSYTEEARRADVNTTIVVSVMVSEDGLPQDIKIVRGAGFGLDEMVVRALETWRFQPGTKDGKAVRAPANVEFNIRALDKTHAGQTARLNFSLPAGVERPELTNGKIPSNPDPPGAAAFRVRFTVSPDGHPRNFQVLETNNPDWTDRALREMADWRFKPAMREGQPEEVNGILELTLRQRAPENRPALSRRLVTISPPEPQDTSLPAPKPISPVDQAIFSGFPRHLTCKWEASPGAVSYLLEWDYMDRGTWHAESEGIRGAAYEVNGTETAFDFIGAQPGRWRVWPVNSSGQRGNPSEWRTFRYLQ